MTSQRSDIEEFLSNLIFQTFAFVTDIIIHFFKNVFANCFFHVQYCLSIFVQNIQDEWKLGKKCWFRDDMKQD